jgi:hypothetical protein
MFKFLYPFPQNLKNIYPNELKFHMQAKVDAFMVTRKNKIGPHSFLRELLFFRFCGNGYRNLNILGQLWVIKGVK